MGPLRCALRPSLPLNVSKIPNRAGPSFSAYHVVVPVSCCASGSADFRKSSSSFSFPAFASSDANSANRSTVILLAGKPHLSDAPRPLELQLDAMGKPAPQRLTHSKLPRAPSRASASPPHCKWCERLASVCPHGTWLHWKGHASSFRKRDSRAVFALF